MLAENDDNRCHWTGMRVRHFTVTRMFVDLSQLSTLNPRAYLKAASAVEALMTLEFMYGAKARGSANLVQHFDVTSAEGYSRRAKEKLKFMLRNAQQPYHIRQLTRMIESISVQLERMVDSVRESVQMSIAATAKRHSMIKATS